MPPIIHNMKGEKKLNQTFLMLAATAAADDLAADHPFLDGLLNAISSLGSSFGSIADGLMGITIKNEGNLATALTNIGAGLVTFFMVLEIVTYCFNVDFHAGFESALKIGVKTVLLYIIVENCQSAASLVIGIFKMNTEFEFAEKFASITDGLGGSIAPSLKISDDADFVTKTIMPIAIGAILIVMLIAIFIIFAMVIISMIGIVAETAILTALAPIATSTLVNSQVRQTGITFLKALAAISMQWGVIGLCFDIFNAITTAISSDAFKLETDVSMISAFFSTLAPMLCLIALATMISKSGEITKRALGV